MCDLTTATTRNTVAMTGPMLADLAAVLPTGTDTSPAALQLLHTLATELQALAHDWKPYDATEYDSVCEEQQPGSAHAASFFQDQSDE